MHRLTFADHRRSLLQNRYIYAVVSRRAKGLSIGINLNPDKSCNFDCPYCQVDRSILGGERTVDVDILVDELTHLLSMVQEGTIWQIPPFDTADEKMRVVRDISFAGDGEPCSSPQFSEAIVRVGEVCMQFSLPSVRYQLLSNATLFHKPHIQQALSQFWSDGGMVWGKLDAGTPEWFARVDGTHFPFDKILKNLLWAGKQVPITLQCMFHRFGDEGPSLYEQNQWAERIRELIEKGASIALVQVYSTARKPSDVQVHSLSRDELEGIAAIARERLYDVVQAPMIQVY
jgi:wyosine [tRNA(Phe)-imidazoG37] synthetase (radical SAM superfamily)